MKRPGSISPVPNDSCAPERQYQPAAPVRATLPACFRQEVNNPSDNLYPVLQGWNRKGGSLWT